MVDVVLANLEDGEPIESIVRGYNITRDDVVAAVRYGEEQRRIGAND